MIGGDDPRPRWIARLVDELSAFLQERVVLVKPVEECLVDGDAFSCLIRSSPPEGNGFRLCWEGVLGMQPSDGKPHISVSLFLYGRNRRLGLMGHAEGSVLEIDYEGSPGRGGRWGAPEWLPDEFGEYLAYDSWSGEPS
ncbi:hypothetical protein [Actinomadura sp. 21ATH]|uniref:hypothetical protein n=1 Tax=Actinomadura sp. 21ATH TaxID=1735444 RepID=UPI0035C13F02